MNVATEVQFGDVGFVDRDGVTALMKAVEGRHRAAVELLLRHGADVNAGDRRTWTPLTYAADRPSPRYSPPRTPGRKYASGPCLELVDRLREAGAAMSLREAVILGDVDLARGFCDSGADPSGR